VAGRYLVALGANMRHHRHGAPERVLAAAFAALDAVPGISLDARSPIIRSAPLGPSRRRYANAAAVLRSEFEPEEMLLSLKAVEQTFGRRRPGRRWRERMLDLDVVLWSGGSWASPSLTVPHVAFRVRDFVLRPAAAVAGDWRDPLTGLSIRQLLARLTRQRPPPT